MNNVATLGGTIDRAFRAPAAAGNGGTADQGEAIKRQCAAEGTGN